VAVALPTKKSRSTPVRTCIGCRTAKASGELMRVTIGTDGKPVVGRSEPGRGAWLCPEFSCIEAAGSRKAFSRAFRLRLADPIFADTLSGWLCSQHR
jgi:predicted RNA-binding protein YlxR (DUF448 family)